MNKKNRIILLAAMIVAAVSQTFAQGNGLAGINEATSMVTSYFLTSSLRHPKIFVKEFSDFLMSCHQHCLGVNLLVQR